MTIPKVAMEMATVTAKLPLKYHLKALAAPSAPNLSQAVETSISRLKSLPPAATPSDPEAISE